MISTTYPDAPGFKTGGTSAQAAFAVKKDAATLRGRCLELVKMRGDVTADEAAAMLEETPFAIRPRFTELSQKGFIFDSGKRRKNASGHSAIVWTLDRQQKLF